MHSRLFMAHQNVLDRILLVKRVVNMKNSATRVTPDELDAFCLQGFDKNLCATKLLLIGYN